MNRFWQFLESRRMWGFATLIAILVGLVEIGNYLYFGVQSIRGDKVLFGDDLLLENPVADEIQTATRQAAPGVALRSEGALDLEGTIRLPNINKVFRRELSGDQLGGCDKLFLSPSVPRNQTRANSVSADVRFRYEEWLCTDIPFTGNDLKTRIASASTTVDVDLFVDHTSDQIILKWRIANIRSLPGELEQIFDINRARKLERFDLPPGFDLATLELAVEDGDLIVYYVVAVARPD